MTQEKGLSTFSRRTFLGLGASAALLAGAGLAGCAPKGKTGTASGNGSDENTSWAKEADVVICGLGGAGVAAAVEAAEAGASVIVLEMAGEGGGATKMSGGLAYFGGGTRLQKACGIEDSLDNYKAYMKAVSNPSGGNEQLVDLYCEESASTFDWLEAHGVPFDDAADTQGHVVTAPKGISLTYSGNERGWEYVAVATPAPRGHSPRQDGEEHSAAMLFDPLLTAAEKAGAEIIYNAEATSLIVDGSGRVVGVRATIDNEESAIRGLKGVILTTGAFTMNDEMLADFCHEGLAAGARTAHPNDTGSGIKMGMAIGAGLRSMGRASIQHFVYMYGHGAASGMLVDKRGVRFIDEGSYGGWIGKAIYERTPEAAWLIMDSNMIADVDPAFKDMLDISSQADSIEDLARVIDIEPATLAATAARYNGFAQSQNDDDFHKATEYLKPLSAPPFYAANFEVSKCGFHTLGGLKINEKSQVVGNDGKVLPGLYSAGRNACAIFGNYPGSGSSIGECLVFGRIAGKNAAAE